MQYIPFGDSHCIFWANQDIFPNLHPNDPEISKIHWFGPAKAWGLKYPTENLTFERFVEFKKKLSESPSSIPIACFGEIDIRINVVRRVLRERRFNAIAELAEVYLESISQITANQVIIWGPGPSVRDASQTTLNAAFPSFGSEFTRNAITHLFNLEILKRISNFGNIKFVTLFYDLVDSSLLATKEALRDDGVHIAPGWYNRAKQMVELVSTDAKAKAVLNWRRIIKIPEFEIFENPTPDFKNVYKLYKFYGEKPSEIFLSGFVNSLWDQVTEIEIRPKTGNTNEIFDLADEYTFVTTYFSISAVSNIKTVEDYTTFVLERLNSKNSEGFDVTTLSPSLDRKFALSHFDKIIQNILNTSNVKRLMELRSFLSEN